MIFELVEDALSMLAVPFAADKMIMDTGQELPDLFMTYRLISSPPVAHADDRETLRSWRVQVSIYSRDGLNALPNVAGAMTDFGFSKSNIAQISKSADTGHYGMAMDFIFTSDEEELTESY